MGSKGLEDRRGRRVGSLPSRTPEEELRDRIVELERKNLDLQMENDTKKWEVKVWKTAVVDESDHYQVVHLRKNYVIESLSLKEKILIYKWKMIC